MIGAFLLLVLSSGLERLSKRPFLATLTGRMFAHLLRARQLKPHVYEVHALPALGFKASAQTWGETILVVRGRQTRQLLAHEAVHTEQFRRYTSLGFWLLYVAQWVVGLVKTRNLYRAYFEMGLEREARSSVHGLNTTHTRTSRQPL